MELSKSLCFLPFFLLAAFCFPAFAAQKAYVIYLGDHSNFDAKLSVQTDKLMTESHVELLNSYLKSKEKAMGEILYSYTRYINGFATILHEEDAMEISKFPGVLSVFENRRHKFHTTRSWQFLGLEKDGKVPMQSLWKKARFGEDVIIANLDYGVWPESESFRDDGMGPIPSRWKGICQSDNVQKFSCNRKLIGARYFNKGHEAATGLLNITLNTPRDLFGHGTHTLSTAGGNFVPGASLFGFANGTAKGGSPRARVAAYKVCWIDCYDIDILAGFEAAIKDGVDVISVSLGHSPSHSFGDSISIGAFHAVKNGISVVAAAGNDGPAVGSVSNISPWLLTVGASTIDREFPSFVVFKNKSLKGQSLSEKSLPKNKLYHLIRSADAGKPNVSIHDAEHCKVGSLDRQKVKGKIVICITVANETLLQGEAVKLAGGAGMVLANDVSSGDNIYADAHVLPATHISISDGLELLSYVDSSKSPKASLTRATTVLGTKPAPLMAFFSSQGPNIIHPEILKPDITAPGESVLAVFTEADSPTNLKSDKRRSPFNIWSGTSMSCPHIAGIVGLLKAVHPDWSPSAIKSAIMTTATVLDSDGEPMKNFSLAKANPFNYGSGHVRPNRAVDPGLVYDLNITDYLNFLCAIGYNSTQIAVFKKHDCPSKTPSLVDFNYPAITIPNLEESITIRRVVTNVGTPGTYVAHVQNPTGIEVTVKPDRLQFERIGEVKAFEVTLKTKNGHVAKEYVFGVLRWSDGKHQVRSPITVKSKGF